MIAQAGWKTLCAEWVLICTYTTKALDCFSYLFLLFFSSLLLSKLFAVVLYEHFPVVQLILLPPSLVNLELLSCLLCICLSFSHLPKSSFCVLLLLYPPMSLEIMMHSLLLSHAFRLLFFSPSQTASASLLTSSFVVQAYICVSATSVCVSVLILYAKQNTSLPSKHITTLQEHKHTLFLNHTKQSEKRTQRKMGNQNNQKKNDTQRRPYTHPKSLIVRTFLIFSLYLSSHTMTKTT